MKNINRFISLALSVAALYFLFVHKTGNAFTFGWVSLLMAIVFACFSIMEEQKEEIERLRKGIDSYQKSMSHSGDVEIFTNTDGKKYFRIKEK